MRYEDWVQLGLGMILLGFVLWIGTSPAPEASRIPSAYRDDKITLLAGGDVNMGRLIGQKILAGGIDYPFTNIADTLRGADITFVNLESQLADLGGETQSPTNEYRFAGPPEGAISLANAGIDIVSIANNHMWDYGKDALFETIDNLEMAGVLHVGASKNMEDKYKATIIEVKNQKVAFLAMTTLLNGYERFAQDYVSFNNEEEIVKEIRRIRDDVDYLFVSIHTGTEYKLTPDKLMEQLSHRFIDEGADGVIGHHPHVPQPIEMYNEKPILYSLGNFAFWQPFSFETQHSYLAELVLDNGTIKLNTIPINSGWQPSLDLDESSIRRTLSLIYPTS